MGVHTPRPILKLRRCKGNSSAASARVCSPPPDAPVGRVGGALAGWRASEREERRRTHGEPNHGVHVWLNGGAPCGPRLVSSAGDAG